MKMPSHPFCDLLLLDSEEEDMFFVLLCVAAGSEETVPRASYHVRDRIEWDAHVAELSLEENAFSCCCISCGCCRWEFGRKFDVPTPPELALPETVPFDHKVEFDLRVGAAFRENPSMTDFYNKSTVLPLVNNPP